jgi:teichuronic acid biosynthesis glycosyltransferase TuaH
MIEKQNNKILYLMHVHWGWIKQRPQFVAEYLSQKNKLTVCCGVSIRKRELNSEITSKNLDLKKIFILPLSRYIFIFKLNSIISRVQIAKHLRSNNIVWLTHSDMYEPIKNIIPKTSIVVYDCMDDALALPSSVKVRNRLLETEALLIERSDLVFASSNHLKTQLKIRYETKKNIHVVNNAINLVSEKEEKNQITHELESLFNINSNIKIVYIGTIAEWFDFDLLLESIKLNSNITYILIGPATVAVPICSQIIYHPAVEHKYVNAIMERADALIMPFILNDLVLSVNPVKAYEYIHSGKPTIIVDYGETKQFSEYAYLYKCSIEFHKLIGKIANKCLMPKKNIDACILYGVNNSWKSRVFEMASHLDKIKNK